MSPDPSYDSGRESRQEPVREREVIVTEGGGDRGPGGVLAVIVGVAALVLVVWLLITNLGGGDGEVEGPSLDVPEQVDINVNDGGAGGADGS